MKKQNIVLIGFRGCGKTYFGREMARIAKLPFVDLDHEVERLIGRSIYDFVEEHGWQVFREIEQRVVYDFSRHFSGIIATGGGTIENSKNLQTLSDFGHFVFLNTDYSQVRKYLLDTAEDRKRPRLNPDIPLAMELDQMWNQRKGMYAASAEVEVSPDLYGNLEEEAIKMLSALPKRIVPSVAPKRKVVVLSSSRGSTLKGLLAAQAEGRIPNVEFVSVITDKKDAGALDVAKEAKIPTEVLTPQKGETREEYDRELMNIIREHDLQKHDRIILAGWMRILSPLYCASFGDVSYNVHPSLLPDYTGMMGDAIHEAVLMNGDRYTGATIHKVTAEVDGGEHVTQRKVVVEEGDTVESLRRRVQVQEVLGFCEALERK